MGCRHDRVPRAGQPRVHVHDAASLTLIPTLALTLIPTLALALIPSLALTLTLTAHHSPFTFHPHLSPSTFRPRYMTPHL